MFLQLRKNVAVVFVESWRDVTDHVCAVTKSLSKRPLKYAAPPAPRSLSQKLKVWN